jgi:hypothetical protein
VQRLQEAIAERGSRGYLLTVSDGGTPHAVHTAVRWEDGAIVADVGKRTAANAAARPVVSVLFPVRGDRDYSLIVDGTADVSSRDGASRLAITPTKAVLHRPAAAPDPASACAADCVPLLPGASGSAQRR